MAEIREILVTNDDGISAPGINALAHLLREYGNVTVVAPIEAQSGKSASFSMDKILRLNRISEAPAEGRLHAIRYFAFNGTPVDCVKMGVNIFKDEGRMPDFVASGINHGSNASAAAIYSGTLGATREGTVYDVPSAGFSIDSHDTTADLSAVLSWSRTVLDNIFAHGIAPGTFLNINFPDLPADRIKGFKVARQGIGRWEREFQRRVDPRGREYFWIVGDFIDMDTEGSDGDHKIVGEGWISVCPMKIDNTDYQEMGRISREWGI